MKILVFGGTLFLGRHLVEAAQARGHEVTLFHRGHHGVDLYPDVEQMFGDRRSGLQSLAGRQWDVVIDPSGYVPGMVRASARALADVVTRYIFISSVSVYADQGVIGLTEEEPVSTMTPEQVAEAEDIVPSPQSPTIARLYGEAYGALKVLCERTLEEIMPGRTLAIRPGLIVGPYDYTDRFTYWVERVARGGEVLAPGNPEAPVQYIDASDLAAWILRLAEAGQTGIYNATGLEGLTMHHLLETCQAVSGSAATFTWLPEAFLLHEQVQPWSQLPLWLPDDPADAGFQRVNSAKARAVGLTYRPLEETIRATLDWALRQPADRLRDAGLPADDETRLLRLWHEQQAASS